MPCSVRPCRLASDLRPAVKAAQTRPARPRARRLLGHGDELRIYLDDQLVISYLHRHGALDALQAQSAQHLESFKELGWQQV